MRVVRNIYKDAPVFIEIPNELRHKCIEIIILPLDEDSIYAKDFKSWLSGAPLDIEEDLFERSKDLARGLSWDI